jgi:hypothetical protein
MVEALRSVYQPQGKLHVHLPAQPSHQASVTYVLSLNNGQVNVSCQVGLPVYVIVQHSGFTCRRFVWRLGHATQQAQGSRLL